MKIRINRTELVLFRGATIADAVHIYYALHGKKIPKIFPAVKDRFGNFVAPDGRLTDGNQLYIKTIK
ncbi:MAG TPA: hypothetical protein PKW80_06175 [Bacteroidales bacterium]|nr:hypothetical protein [Bacteroidales bacterium]